MFRSKKPVPVALVCTACAGAMAHTHSIPSAVGLEEMLAFRCGSCGWLRTVDRSSVSAIWSGSAAG